MKYKKMPDVELMNKIVIDANIETEQAAKISVQMDRENNPTHVIIFFHKTKLHEFKKKYYKDPFQSAALWLDGMIYGSKIRRRFLK